MAATYTLTKKILQSEYSGMSGGIGHGPPEKSFLALNNLQRSGTIQFTEATAVATVPLGTGFAAAPAVAVLRAASGAAAAAVIASATVTSAGNLVVTLSAAPGAGETRDVGFSVDARSTETGTA